MAFDADSRAMIDPKVLVHACPNPALGFYRIHLYFGHSTELRSNESSENHPVQGPNPQRIGGDDREIQRRRA